MKDLSKKDIKDLIDRGIIIPLHKVKDKDLIADIKKLTSKISNKNK